MSEKKHEMKKIDIKGKDYVPVNERLLAFWADHPEKDWSIIPEIDSLENGVVIMTATIYDQNGRIVTAGHAYEKENSTFINKTSFIENCETSAIGRALGNLGYGIDTSVASYEEVANAIKQQEQEKRPKMSFSQLLNALDNGFDEIGANNIFLKTIEDAGYDLESAYALTDKALQKDLYLKINNQLKTLRNEK
jgi:hypothetical protein